MRHLRQYLGIVVALCMLSLNAHAAQTPPAVTYTISGNIGTAGVMLKGPPDITITDARGNYSVEVPSGWSGKITPVKDGYWFEPQSIEYARVRKNHPNKNYAGKRIILTIAGNTGVPRVVLKGLPNDPVSDANGAYSVKVPYGFKGIVRPHREGCFFEPPSIAYTNVRTNHSDQDYVAGAITYQITGNAGIAGVALKGLPGNHSTDSNGDYSATVEYGWSGNIHPSKEGYTFSPGFRVYNKVISNHVNEDFAAERVRYKISGNVGVPDVLLLGAPIAVLSDARGNYEFKVEHGWKGIIKPSKAGYRFVPVAREYTPLIIDRSRNDYTAKVTTYEISGNTGMSGVVLKGLPGDPISDAKGNYSVKVPYGWAGSVRPSKEGYVFAPAFRRYPKIIEAKLDENYRAAPIRFTISGHTSVPGVVLKGLPGNPTTGAQGKYKVEVPDGWCGIVIPYRQGYSFEPSSRKYPSVRVSMAYENFLGARDPVTISGTVVIGGKPVSGVRMTADNGGGFDITDAQGNFRVPVPYGWSGNLTPKKDGWYFSPESSPYKDVKANIHNGEEQRSPQPSYTLGSDAKVLIVPISKIAPEEFDHLVQDTNVMLHILRKNINKEQAGPAGAVFSDFGSFLGQPDRPFKAIYIQDYGILFSLEVEMPMAPPAPPAGSDAQDVTGQDSIWQRAQRELNQPPQTGLRMGGLSYQQLDPDEVVTDLIVLLRHASNIRHLGPNDRIIVTLLGKSPAPGTGMMTGAMGMGGYGGGGGGMGMGGGESGMMMGGGMGGFSMGAGVDPTNPAGSQPIPDPALEESIDGMMGSDGGTEGDAYKADLMMMEAYGDMGGYGMGEYGGVSREPTLPGGMGALGMPGTSFVRMVVTVHVKKSTIDDFAQGRIDFKQFREAVQVFKY